MRRGETSGVPTAAVRGTRRRRSMSNVRNQHGQRGLPANVTLANGCAALAWPYRHGTAAADHATAAFPTVAA